jgi:hypothetical protein
MSLGRAWNARETCYVDLTLSSLSEAARRALEALMKSGTYEPQFPLFREWLAQGRAEGRQEGRLEGLHEGEQTALLEVLDARGIEVDVAARRQIQACTDLSQLKVWLRKAATAESVQELFESVLAPKPVAGKSGQSTKAPRSRSKR